MIHPSGAAATADQFRIRQPGELLGACRERAHPEPGARAARRAPGLTQQQVARLLSVSDRHYRNLERGRLRRPEPTFLDQVARALSMSLAEREVLYHLAAEHAPARRPTRANLDAMQEWIDAAPDQPAVVTDLAWNVLLWNRDEPLMLQDPAQVPEQDRNAILWMFGEVAR